MITMYPGMPNSPKALLTAAIAADATNLTVDAGAKLPAAPNLAVLGVGDDAETILYTVKSGNVLSGITRAVQGTAQAWPLNTVVARNFTEKDYAAILANLHLLFPSDETAGQALFWGAGGVESKVAADARAALESPTAKHITAGSMNDLSEPGIYYVSATVTDKPTLSGGIVVVAKSTTGVIAQILWGASPGDPIYRRVYLSGAWNTWEGAPLISSGTWTLTLYGTVTAGTPTYNYRNGTWIRIGDLVYITGRVEITNKGGLTGFVRISGLPVAAAAISSITVGYYNNATLPSGAILDAYVSNSEISLVYKNNSGVTLLMDSNVSDTFSIPVLTGWYKAAS